MTPKFLAVFPAPYKASCQVSEQKVQWLLRKMVTNRQRDIQTERQKDMHLEIHLYYISLCVSVCLCVCPFPFFSATAEPFSRILDPRR